MNRKKLFLAFLVTSLLVPMSAHASEQVQRDNTAVNKSRENESLPSADEAGQSKAEVSLMSSIRQAIIGRNDLSTYAKNIKIIVRGNEVRLAGPVKNADEKAIVEKIARANARSAKVKNEVYVAK